MKLSTFILNNLEPILQEWENFAKVIFSPEQKIDTKKLRDHAKKILQEIVNDLNNEQSELEQIAKSRGVGLKNNFLDTAATLHGVERMAQGFDVNEVLAEYRALRATVTRLFSTAMKEKIQFNHIMDLIRFNEAIDQAITDSVESFSITTEKQRRLFETMLSSSPDFNYILDLEGKFLFVNEAMKALYQSDFQEILGTRNYNFAMPAASDILAHIQYIIKTGKIRRGEIECTSRLNQAQYFEYILAPVIDNEGRVEAIAGVLRNITDRRIAEDQIRQIANSDLLTGLANRRMFLELLDRNLEQIKRSGGMLALLFIDLDKFKYVNDTFGHNVGDLLLKQTAKRISACLRASDTVARIGGDEFTVIISNIDNIVEARLVAEKILSTLSKPFSLKKQKVTISASIGITLSPKDGIASDVLIKNADQAMYNVKKDQGNQLNIY